MEIKRTVKVHSEAETRALGHEIAESLVGGEVIALIGDLGTGKTALTRYIAEGLSVPSRVSSPTFTIVKEHRGGRLPLFHFDVYRVHDEDNLIELGLEEYFEEGGVCLIEWANLIEGMLPEDTKYINIKYGEEEEERIYELSF